MRLPSLESDAGARPSGPPGPRHASPEQGQPPEDARWVLQADAAKRVGCSVSAIRKWRREGSVASRKVTTPAGLERVEVRLDDVLRRAGPRDRTASDPSGASDMRLSVPGTVLVPIHDFQTLLERVAMAEQLAGGLEARLRAIDAEASRMREQFVELRRQIEQERRREDRAPATPPLAKAPAPPRAPASRLPSSPPPPVPVPPPAPAVPAPSPPPPPVPPPLASPVPPAPAAPPASPPPAAPPASPPPVVSEPVPAPSPGTPQAQASGKPRATGRPLREARPAPTPERPPRPASSFRQWLGGRKPPESPAPPPVDVERLGAELRRLYARLQARQGQAEVSPAEAERWVADLAAYDAALVRTCRVIGVPTAYRVGERIPAGDRVALSRALAAAGVDVRPPSTASP